MESELPKYKCRKHHAMAFLSSPRSHVHAAEVVDVVRGPDPSGVLWFDEYPEIDVGVAFLSKFGVFIGGYYVVLSNGTPTYLSAAGFADLYEPDEE